MANKPKRFIAIGTGIADNRLVYLSTSDGTALYNDSGIDFKTAIAWLFDLIHLRRPDFTTVFVCYAFSRDNEFIFATMPQHLKDRLFQSEPIKKQRVQLELENEGLDELLYMRKTVDKDEIAFDRTVNAHALADLVEVEIDGYNIKLANGKSLIIRKGGKVITIYDIFGFFKPAPLEKVAHHWLGKNLMVGNRRHELQSYINDPVALLKAQSLLETSVVAAVADKLNTALQSQNITLTRYHGATAITSHWLGKLQAKQEFNNYRYRRQVSPELWKAVRQANYGGRQEQFKAGTVKDVYVYDINSAYAFACSFLPRMKTKPYYAKNWNDSPFSVWYCQYDFSNIPNLYFGFLPNRDFTNATKYKTKGAGYFWQPEITFVKENFPECIEIGGGFVLDYEQSEFGKGIETLYNLRLELQKRGDPLEKVFKLALASLYGKFCQHNGKGHYYNLYYAGFITSLTRMQLLSATLQHQRETVTFQTDAIHSTAGDLPIMCDNTLGNFKRQHYGAITYLDNGVYRCFDLDGKPVKTKTRGFRAFEFERALSEMQNKNQYTALAEFFIGHNLHRQNMFSGADYLSHHAIDKVNSPFDKDRSAMRLFEVFDVDLSKEYIDSKPISTWSGLDSAVCKQGAYKGADMALDTFEAGRV